jgi:hypothetical protein
MTRILIALFVVLLLAGAVFVSLPLDPYQDFQVIYRADRALLHGIALYDRPGQAEFVARDLGVSVDRVFVLPFPYPPWYALATLPLALLPIDAAVRIWFVLNVGMLLVSVWLLTDGWPPRKRLLSFIASLLFLPVLGALIVGQYVFPAMLGAALVVYALEHERVGLVALGMALVTFKPHIGIFILVAVMVHLLRRDDEFGARTFRALLLTGAFLFLTGFIADTAWPVTYLSSLFDFRAVGQCGICVSLPMTFARLAGVSFDQAFLIALIPLAILLALFAGSRLAPGFVQKPRPGENIFIAFFVCVALLVNPYLQNYDFAFALIPLIYLAGSATSRWGWLWIALIFFITWIGPGLYGRAGNTALILSTLLLTAIILTRLYKEHTIDS